MNTVDALSELMARIDKTQGLLTRIHNEYKQFLDGDIKIPALQGVWARHETLERCRRELRGALSDWIALRLGLHIPVIADIDLNQISQPV
jgi:predicted RNase H-like HicB family nuclease